MLFFKRHLKDVLLIVFRIGLAFLKTDVQNFVRFVIYCLLWLFKHRQNFGVNLNTNVGSLRVQIQFLKLLMFLSISLARKRDAPHYILDFTLGIIQLSFLDLNHITQPFKAFLFLIIVSVINMLRNFRNQLLYHQSLLLAVLTSNHFFTQTNLSFQDL